jgi:hypothetical protein
MFYKSAFENVVQASVLANMWSKRQLQFCAREDDKINRLFLKFACNEETQGPMLITKIYKWVRHKNKSQREYIQ